jgi:hypothetical protein
VTGTRQHSRNRWRRPSGWGEPTDRDVLIVHPAEDGEHWRWTRYGRYGEIVDLSADFTHRGAARDDATAKNDIPASLDDR